MNDFQYLDLLQDYHQGRLSPDARQDFERQLSGNDALAAEWLRYQTVVKALKEQQYAATEVGALQQQLEAEGFFDAVHAGILKKRDTAPPPEEIRMTGRRSLHRWMWAAAASVALFAAALWFFNRPDPVSELMSQHLPLDESMTEGFSSQNDTLAQVHQKLRDNQPEAALQLLRSMSAPLSDDAKYLYAWAWYELERWDDCLMKINDVYDDGYNGASVHPDILWKTQLLEAKVFFRKGNRSKALALLEQFILTDTDAAEKRELIIHAKDLQSTMLKR